VVTCFLKNLFSLLLEKRKERKKLEGEIQLLFILIYIDGNIPFMIFSLKKNFTFCFFLILNSQSIQALSLEKGELLFQRNCSVCHLGGNNIILPEKNLKLETLEANGMNSLNAIVYQITNGKNGMPAFGGRLNEEDVEEIAEYVLKASERNFEKENY